MDSSFHKTERCFRRYEKVIAEVVKRFPEPLRFKSVKRSSTTDAARLNDAMTSFRYSNWSSQLIDRSKFVDNVYKQVAIVAEGEEVVVCPRAPQDVEVMQVSGQRFAGVVDMPSDDQIRLAVAAIDANVVELPIQLNDLTPEQISLVEQETSQRFNVAVRQDQNHITLL